MENFVLKAKKAIKRVAAISVGVAMLGATMGGALAADYTLKDYPTPFTGSDSALIIGSSADAAAAADIALGLPKKTSSSSGTKSEDEISDEIPLGMSIANSTSIGFDSELDEGDLSSLQDVSVSFQSNDYDARDVLLLSKGNAGPRPVTSLTSGSAVEDDYEDNVFLEVGSSDKIKYFYAFDDSVNISKATTAKPLEVKFLGKTLKITSVDTTDLTKFTAYVGTEYFMNVGDTVTVEGKKIKLENVGSGGAILVSVDGVMDTISSSNSKTVNGIEVSNDETFYEDTKAGRAASLVIGKDSQRTYKDADPFTGEDENDPKWVWDTGNLAASTSTTINQTAGGNLISGSDGNAGPHLGIENDFILNDASDNPPGIGECLELPNNYASICLDSLSVKDEDYTTLTIEYQSSTETSKSGQTGNGASASQGTIHIKSGGEDTLLISANNLTVNANSTQDRKTNEIWLALNGTLTAGDNNRGGMAVYYKDSDKSPTMQYAGTVNLDNTSLYNSVFRLNYGKTKNDRLTAYVGLINLSDGGSTTAGAGTLSFRISARGASTNELTDNSDNIFINFTIATSNISALGTSASLEESGEIAYAGALDASGKSVVGTQTITLGTKDENHRTKYGIIIQDPKSNGASDKVVLKIPTDQVQANVIIRGVAVSGGASSSTSSADTMNAADVTDVTLYNAILVGGPCANSLTAKVMGTSGECTTGFTPGEAILDLRKNGEKYALIVAGYSADDTKRAAMVLKSVAAGESQFLLAGNSKTVKGTTLELSGITVE